jgi:rubredoxin
MMRYRCPGCGYIYDEARGDAHQGFAPGTTWAQIPANWPCPDCVVNEKEDFEPVTPASGDGDCARD